jgi:hypothetical protein
MEEAQTAKRRRLIISIAVIKRQDLLEKEIPFSYSVKGEGSQNITRY